MSQTQILALVLAIVPAVFLVIYFYHKDNHPEPKDLIVKVFLWGIFSTIPAIVLELVASSFLPRSGLFGAAVSSFLVAGLCEEWVKMQVVMRVAYQHRAFDEVVDGIIYTIVASMGFACFENILYVADSNLATALVRAFTAIPMHATASGIMGYYIGRARFTPDLSESSTLLRQGLSLAAFLHGSYDFSIFANEFLPVPTAFLSIPIVWLCWRKLHKLILLANQA